MRQTSTPLAVVMLYGSVVSLTAPVGPSPVMKDEVWGAPLMVALSTDDEQASSV